MNREIVKINEVLCDGCGLCIPSCKEGALQIIDGKARLISDLLCDGLGACLGQCPKGAITIEQREAEPYDEYKVIKIMIEKGLKTVIAHLQHLLEHNEINYFNQAMEYLTQNNNTLSFTIEQLTQNLKQKEQKEKQCGCMGSQTKVFDENNCNCNETYSQSPSQLTHWPIQLHLINPNASLFKNANLLIAADCTAFSFANFHQSLLKGKKLIIACPKLDSGIEVYIEKLKVLIQQSKVNTITLVIMEVPCCGGLLQIVNKAKHLAQSKVPVKLIIIGVEGDILQEEWI